MSKKCHRLLEKIFFMCYDKSIMEVMSSEILTIPPAAKHLRICDKTIIKLISNKKLSAAKKGGSWRSKK